MFLSSLGRLEGFRPHLLNFEEFHSLFRMPLLTYIKSFLFRYKLITDSLCRRSKNESLFVS